MRNKLIIAGVIFAAAIGARLAWHWRNDRKEEEDGCGCT